MKFFWDLFEILPVAEAAEGILHPRHEVLDAINRDPKLLEAMRPVYIDYLETLPDADCGTNIPPLAHCR